MSKYAETVKDKLRRRVSNPRPLTPQNTDFPPLSPTTEHPNSTFSHSPTAPNSAPAADLGVPSGWSHPPASTVTAPTAPHPAAPPAVVTASGGGSGAIPDAPPSLCTAIGAAIGEPGRYVPPTIRELPPAEMPTSALLRRAAVFIDPGQDWRDTTPRRAALAVELRTRAALLETAAGIVDEPAQTDEDREFLRLALAVLRKIGEVRP